MKMSWNALLRVFRRESQPDDSEARDREMNPARKAEEAIALCRKEKREIFERIDTLRKHIAEIIREVFYVPSQYLYTEPELFEQIIAHTSNQGLNPELVEQSRLVVNGYKKEIERLQQRITTLDQLIEGYTSREGNYLSLAGELHQKEDEAAKFDKLEAFHRRLFDLEAAQTADNEPEMLRMRLMIDDEIRNLRDEIQFREEYIRQLNRLRKEYRHTEDADKSEPPPDVS